MTFQHLENRLSQGSEANVTDYLELFMGLRDPTKTVLGYTLDLASLLDESGLRDSYVLFGGYAVLSHLMSSFGDSVAKVWRGSTDIDMGGTERVLSIIHQGYGVKSDLASPNVKDKRTLKLTEGEEAECKIDFYTGSLAERFPNPEVNYHLGVPLRVASPLSVIAGKLEAPSQELNHSGDILSMLAVLEKREIDPQKIVGYFTPEQRGALHARIKQGIQKFSGDRMGYYPDRAYVSEVQERLHKLRRISQ